MTMPNDQNSLVKQDLLPCPAISLHSVDRGQPYTGFRRADIWFARCGTCGCTTEYFATEGEAITAWNTRLSQPVGVDEEAVVSVLFDHLYSQPSEEADRAWDELCPRDQNRFRECADAILGLLSPHNEGDSPVLKGGYSE